MNKKIGKYWKILGLLLYFAAFTLVILTRRKKMKRMTAEFWNVCTHIMLNNKIKIDGTGKPFWDSINGNVSRNKKMGEQLIDKGILKITSEGVIFNPKSPDGFVQSHILPWLQILKGNHPTIKFPVNKKLLAVFTKTKLTNEEKTNLYTKINEGKVPSDGVCKFLDKVRSNNKNPIEKYHLN